MMRTKVVFGLLVLFLVAVHFADAQVKGGRKCKTRENYRSVGNQNCDHRRTEWETVIEEDDYRVDCHCRGGLFRIRHCIKCNYGTSTTTVVPTTVTEQSTTEGSTDATSVNPGTSPVTAAPSTEIPEITSPNPGTSEFPVNPSTTEAPQVSSVPTEISVDTTIAF